MIVNSNVLLYDSKKAKSIKFFVGKGCCKEELLHLYCYHEATVWKKRQRLHYRNE